MACPNPSSSTSPGRELAHALLCAVDDNTNVSMVLAACGLLLYHDHEQQVEVDVIRNRIGCATAARLDVYTPDPEQTASLDLDVLDESVDLQKHTAIALADGLLCAVGEPSHDDDLFVQARRGPPGLPSRATPLPGAERPDRAVTQQRHPV